jgi:3-hydroxyisobutyrate dehydrogenase
MPERVALIGLGNMGAPMSRRLTEGGHEVHGFDLSSKALDSFAAAGGTPHDSAPAAATGASLVIFMLPSSTIVDSVLDELRTAGVLNNTTIYIDMSSSEPLATRANASALGIEGIDFIDAPVSGGVGGAIAGTLTVMVGGPAPVVERVRPVLECFGRVVHIGDVGTGDAMKALNNLVSAVHLWATGEAVAAAQRFGIDPARFIDVLNTSSGRSGSSEVKWPKFILPETYDSGFSAGLMLKDTRIAIGLAEQLGVPAVLGEELVARWSAAVADLGPGADHTEVARWIVEHPGESAAGSS